MEDGAITDEEIKIQFDKVIAMLHDIEAKYSKEHLKNLFVEISVLYAVYNFHSIQKHKFLKKYETIQHKKILPGLPALIPTIAGVSERRLRSGSGCF